MERLLEEIPNFFTIWNIIFLGKAMGVTFLLTAIGCLVGFSVGGLLAVFRKTKSLILLPLRFFIVIYTEIFRRIPFLVSLIILELISSEPVLLNPSLFIRASSSSNLNTLGLGFPYCGLGVIVPTSTKPKPRLNRGL